MLADIASEAFIPFAYGGGVSTRDHAAKLFKLGVEKVIINSAAFENANLISELAAEFGSQSVVVCIDVKNNLWGRETVYVRNGTVNTKNSPVEYANRMEELGAGELIVSSISRDGTGIGYDIGLISSISDSVSIPVVALGGAGNLSHLKDATTLTSVSALAAGDMFVFTGRHKAVLISYPGYDKLNEIIRGI